MTCLISTIAAQIHPQAPAFASGGEEKIIARIIIVLGQPAVVERAEVAAIGITFAIDNGEPCIGSVGGVVLDRSRRTWKLELWIALAVVINEDFTSAFAVSAMTNNNAVANMTFAMLFSFSSSN